MKLGTISVHRRTLVRIANEAEAFRSVRAFPWRHAREPTVGDLPRLTFLRLAAILAADRFSYAVERYIEAARIAPYLPDLDRAYRGPS